MKKFLTSLVLALVLVLACCVVANAAPIEITSKTVVTWEEVDGGSITTIDGHAVNNLVFEISKYPTCTERGIAKYICLDPSTETTPHYHTVYIKALGHKWASQTEDREWGKIIEKATCTSEGKAQDICLRCKEPREVYRTIEKTPHEYITDDNDYLDPKRAEFYKVITPATCTKEGKAQRLCLYCKEPQVDDAKKAVEIKIHMVEHKWSDWKVEREATCAMYGYAERACLVCNAEQSLGYKNGQWFDTPDGLIEKTEGVTILNPNWNRYAYDDDESVFKTQAEFDAYLKNRKYEAEEVKNWLDSCYSRHYYYTCPICKGTIHDNIEIILEFPLTVAHVWDTKAKYSQPATCTENGYNVYYCIYDDDHDLEDLTKDPNYVTTATVNKKDDLTVNHIAKVEIVKALGHDWDEWELIRTYTKDGVEYGEYLRECKRCHETQEELRELTEAGDAKTTGLEQTTDGAWIYVKNGEFQSEYTGIVTWEGGEFWVVKGKVASDANGLTICPDGKAYFLLAGQILRVDGVQMYDNEWFMIKNGELNTSANGLYNYDTGRFIFAAGKLNNTYSGLWANPQDGKWYYIADGQVVDYSGVASYDGRFFVVSNGVLNDSYNGTIEYDGATFEVVNGQLGVVPVTVEETVEE